MNAFAFTRRTAREIAREAPPAAASAAAEVVEAVRAGGDAALRSYAARFGDPAPREVTTAEMLAALDAIPRDLRAALERTHARIERFAEAQKAALREFSYRTGGFAVGQRLIPLDSVGAYVPSGAHPLPSTALMTVTPARVAGVGTVVACTPRPTDVTMAACAIAGVDRLFVCGGAQAIAALAYGTATMPRVAKIVGPGNAYVAAAKRAVAGACGTDLPAGPSEVAVVAGADADAEGVARSLLAEAEHDPDARAYLVCDDDRLLAAVEVAIERQLATLATATVAGAALGASAAVVCGSLAECADAANLLAVEHVELHGPAAETLAPRITCCGALFVGAPAAFGDYGIGPNHTLPTNAAARYASGLSVYDFLLVRPYARALEPEDDVRADAALIAEAEGLPGHRAALLAQSPDPRHALNVS